MAEEIQNPLYHGQSMSLDAAAENEACAQLADQVVRESKIPAQREAARDVARRIRARRQQP